MSFEIFNKNRKKIITGNYIRNKIIALSLERTVAVTADYKSALKNCTINLSAKTFDLSSREGLWNKLIDSWDGLKESFKEGLHNWNNFRGQKSFTYASFLLIALSAPSAYPIAAGIKWGKIGAFVPAFIQSLFANIFYSWFVDSKKYFGLSMAEYNKLIAYVEKDMGESFIWNAKIDNKNLQELFYKLDSIKKDMLVPLVGDVKNKEAALDILYRQLVDNGYITEDGQIQKGWEAKKLELLKVEGVDTVKLNSGIKELIKYRLDIKRLLDDKNSGVSYNSEENIFSISYGISQDESFQIDKFLDEQIAIIENKLNNGELPDSERLKLKKQWGELFSVRFLIRKRDTFPMSGKVNRSLADTWFIEVPINFYLPEQLETSCIAGLYIHHEPAGKKILQINHNLTKLQYNDLLVHLYSLPGDNADLIKKVKIAYKITHRLALTEYKDKNFLHETHTKSRLEAKDETDTTDITKRTQAAIEITTTFGAPFRVPLNQLYSSIHQLSTTPLRLVAIINNDSRHTFEATSMGLGLSAREVEARMHAIMNVLHNKENIDIRALLEKEQKDKKYSRNFYEIFLHLADPYGRQAENNMVLGEAIAELFPVDGIRRREINIVLNRLHLLLNTDGMEHLSYSKDSKIYLGMEFFKNEAKKVIFEDIPENDKQISLADALKKIAAEFRKKGDFYELTDLEIEEFVLLYKFRMERRNETFELADYIKQLILKRALTTDPKKRIAEIISNTYNINFRDASDIINKLEKNINIIEQKKISYIGPKEDAESLNNFCANDDNFMLEDFFRFVRFSKIDVLEHKSSKVAYKLEVDPFGDTSMDHILFDSRQDIIDYFKKIDDDNEEKSLRKAGNYQGGLLDVIWEAVEFELRKDHSLKVANAKRQDFANDVIKAGTDLDKKIIKQASDIMLKVMDVYSKSFFDLEEIYAEIKRRNQSRDINFIALDFYQKYQLIWEENFELFKARLSDAGIKENVRDTISFFILEYFNNFMSTLRGNIYLANKLTSNINFVENRALLAAGKQREMELHDWLDILRTMRGKYEEYHEYLNTVPVINDMKDTDIIDNFFIKMLKIGVDHGRSGMGSVNGYYSYKEIGEQLEDVMKKILGLLPLNDDRTDAFHIPVEKLMQGIDKEPGQLGGKENIENFGTKQIIICSHQDIRQDFYKLGVKTNLMELSEDQKVAIIKRISDIMEYLTLEAELKRYFMVNMEKRKEISRDFSAEMVSRLFSRHVTRDEIFKAAPELIRLAKKNTQKSYERALNDELSNYFINAYESFIISKKAIESIFGKDNEIEWGKYIKNDNGKVKKADILKLFGDDDIWKQLFKDPDQDELIFNSNANYIIDRMVDGQQIDLLVRNKLRGILKNTYDFKEIVELLPGAEEEIIKDLEEKNVNKQTKDSLRMLLSLMYKHQKFIFKPYTQDIIKKLENNELKRKLTGFLESSYKKPNDITGEAGKHGKKFEDFLFGIELLGFDSSRQLFATYYHRAQHHDSGANVGARIAESFGYIVGSLVKNREMIKVQKTNNGNNLQEPDEFTDSSMFYVHRNPPTEARKKKPNNHNFLYLGTTPMEHVQKTIKVLIKDYRNQKNNVSNSVISFKDIWESMKKEMKKDTISINMPYLPHQGAEFAYMDEIEKWVSLMDELANKGFIEYEGRNQDKVDRRRDDTDKVHDLFVQTAKAMLEIAKVSMSRTDISEVMSGSELYTESIYKEMQVLGIIDGNGRFIKDITSEEGQLSIRQDMAQSPLLDAYADRLLGIRLRNLAYTYSVFFAKKTMGEKAYASFATNSDKDNFFKNSIMESILYFFKIDEEGNIENRNIGLAQGEQDLNFRVFNPLQKGAWDDMWDATNTMFLYEGLHGYHPPTGCGGWFNRVNDLLYKTTRTVLDIQPTQSKLMSATFKDRLFSEVIPTAGFAATAAFTSLGLISAASYLGFGELGMVAAPLASFAAAYGFKPWIQKKTENYWKHRKLEMADFYPAQVVRRLDYTKEYTAIEDYSHSKEFIKSMIFTVQVQTMLHQALAEGDWDVVVDVQFPRWNLEKLATQLSEMLDAQLFEDMMKQDFLARSVFKEYPKVFQQRAFNNQYSLMTAYMYNFSLSMAVFAVLGVSVFNFYSSALSVLFGPIGSIAAFAAIGLWEYKLIKSVIRNHRMKLGQSMQDLNFALSRFLMINGALISKINQRRTALDKAPFISSEPVPVTKRREFDDIYLKKPVLKGYWNTKKVKKEDKEALLAKFGKSTEWKKFFKDPEAEILEFKNIGVDKAAEIIFSLPEMNDVLQNRRVNKNELTALVKLGFIKRVGYTGDKFKINPERTDEKGKIQSGFHGAKLRFVGEMLNSGFPTDINGLQFNTAGHDFNNAEVIQELVAKGYLDANGCTTEKFNPTALGFKLNIDAKFYSIKEYIIDVIQAQRKTRISAIYDALAELNKRSVLELWKNSVGTHSAKTTGERRSEIFWQKVELFYKKLPAIALGATFLWFGACTVIAYPPVLWFVLPGLVGALGSKMKQMYASQVISDWKASEYIEGFIAKKGQLTTEELDETLQKWWNRIATGISAAGYAGVAYTLLPAFTAAPLMLLSSALLFFALRGHFEVYKNLRGFVNSLVGVADKKEREQIGKGN